MNRRPKTAFGDYLVSQIKRADMTQEEFYHAVDIKKPYFYDILTATPPSKKVQDKMLSVLESKTGVDSERRNKFYDLAAQERKEIPADILKMIGDNPQKYNEIRGTLANLLISEG